MDLDRGALARIDRKILSSLGQDERYQMVRVPASSAMWLTWRRYYAALGLSMGRGVAGLIARELSTVIEREMEDTPVFSAELGRKLAARTEGLDARERRLNEREWTLTASEQRLRATQRLIRIEQLPLASDRNVGRNERCPCHSGLKYKRCHGLAGRRT